MCRNTFLQDVVCIHNQYHCYAMVQMRAKFPHSPIYYYACRSLLTENNNKNNATAVKICAVFVLFFVVKQTTTHIEPHA